MTGALGGSSRSPGRSTPTVRVPGSKSITNRALVCAALADGDERARRRAARRRHRGDGRLPARARRRDRRRRVDRADRRSTAAAAQLPATDARARRAPVRHDGAVRRCRCSRIGHGRYEIDGGEPMRRAADGPADRRAAGARRRRRRAGRARPSPARCSQADGVDGGRVSLSGRRVEPVPLGPAAGGAVLRRRASTVELTTELVSRPYVELTRSVMRAFGVGRRRISRSRPVGYRGRTFADRAGRVDGVRTSSPRPRSAAAGCASTGSARSVAAGRPRVRRRARARWARPSSGTTTSTDGHGTGRAARHRRRPRATSPTRSPTLAVVAAFADAPDHDHRHRVHPRQGDRPHRRRRHRAAALRHRRRRARRRADRSIPGAAHGAVDPDLRRPPHGDGFALLGLRVPGIEIADPGCVAKTFPEFFDALDRLRGSDGVRRVPTP